MKSIKARIKHRFGKHFPRVTARGSVTSLLEVLVGRTGSSSRINRYMYVTAAAAAARRNNMTNSTQSSDPTDFSSSSSTKQRFPWGSRKSTASHSRVRESVSIAGRRRTTSSPKLNETRTSTDNYSQTDKRISHDKHGKSLLTVHSGISQARSRQSTAPDPQWQAGRRRQIADNYTRRKTEARLVTTKCNAVHDGRKLLQERMMVEVDVLFKLLFSPSQFLQSFHDRRETTDLRMGLWAKNASGQNERTVTMTVTLAANIGPKSAKVTETQTLRECSQPGQLYSIDVRSVNAEIPYADTFEVHIHYCLRAAVDDQTDVLIFAQIRFVKSVWAVVKAFIEKNAYAGLDEFAQSLYSSLLNEIKKL
ncbi:uncharacterized protein Dana_GF11633 [Drosophila ananassae]|uniref:VASt domain-containing protein n=2 Tax=Drosophila ananassae TaxID=7217 RepID=B3MIX6_DROAN|nr:protein Aster-A isoform X1 [Drosophila ananassae]EDV37042.2 uncharacterized protein Dana_GF11633 [Drosophila ananassae]